MIVGVTGNYASGKDVVAEILTEMNFFHVSFSNLIREELKKEKKKINRDNLIQKGNELRRKHGANVLARLALEKVQDGENFVFTSIRNPAEVKKLEEREDFILVKVTAPDAIRLQRIIKRSREGDPRNIRELREKEALENTSDTNSQQLQIVAKMAKVTITNDSTIERLREKIRKFVEDWLFKLQDSRPDWDHYFMDIAHAVKIRSNCMSAKKGAIIVRNKQIVSTGYNGSPKSIQHCSEGGCQRCTSRHLGRIKSGVYSEPCICCHSEENAIVQAAHNGISTKDAVIYTTFTPCTACAKMIINAGIREVIAKVEYPDDIGTKLLKAAGIKLRVLK